MTAHKFCCSGMRITGRRVHRPWSAATGTQRDSRASPLTPAVREVKPQASDAASGRGQGREARRAGLGRDSDVASPGGSVPPHTEARGSRPPYEGLGTPRASVTENKGEPHTPRPPRVSPRHHLCHRPRLRAA